MGLAVANADGIAAMGLARHDADIEILASWGRSCRGIVPGQATLCIYAISAPSSTTPASDSARGHHSEMQCHVSPFHVVTVVT